MLLKIAFLQSQYALAFATSIIFLLCGSCFVWVTPIVPKLHGDNAIVEMTPTEISWMVALYEFGALVPPLPAALAADRWGRMPVMLITGPIILASWFLIMFMRNVIGFYLARILQGCAVGVAATAASMYLSEIASAKIRGSLTALVQTLWYTGFLFGYIIGSYTSYEDNVYINLVLTVFLFMFLYVVDLESPYFLIMHNREMKAMRNLTRLRGSDVSSENLSTEFEQIKESIAMEKKKRAKWSDLIATKADQRILVITQVLTMVRICSGTIAISAYIGNLLEAAAVAGAKLTPTLSLVIFSCVTLIMLLFGTCTVDRIGRRPLLLISCFGSAVANFGASVFYYLNDNTETRLEDYYWVPSVLFISFTFFFSLGLAPVSQTIQSEIFPSHTRGLGNTLSVVNSTAAGFLSLRCYQIVVDYFGLYANFLLYSGICIFGFVYIYIYVPETKGKTLLEIRNYFLDITNPKVTPKEVTKL